MKVPALFAAAFLALSPLAGAGIIIVQEADQLGGMEGKTELTMTLSGERARVDIGKQLSSIVDMNDGSVTSLLHAQKMAMVLPKGALDAVKAKAEATKAKPDLKPTGKKETINGFACTEYTGKLQGMEVTYWVTKDVANEKEILKQMGRLSGGDNPFKAALADGSDFPGFPIRTTITTPAGPSTITVVSVKNQDIPDSTFETPAGYKKMDVPQMSKPSGGAPSIPAGPNGN